MRIAIVMICGLTACTQFPALDGTISDAARDAPYPQLTPIPSFPQSNVDTAENELQARLAVLNARAERLRQTDIGALR